MRAVVLVVLAACGGSQPSEPLPTPPIAPAPIDSAPIDSAPNDSAPADSAPVVSAPVTPPGLPAHFAGLFVAGTKTFPGELVVSQVEENGPVTKKTRGKVTCTVSNVRETRGNTIAKVACSGLERVNYISGTYVGNARGLWKVEDGADLKKLDPSQALFLAVPAKSRNEQKGGDPDSGSAIIVEPHAGGWCALVTSWGGDEDGFQLCVREGAGIIGGHGFFAGGQTRDAYFGDVRRL